MKKWLRNWFWFKKNWFLNKTARRLLFITEHYSSARTRLVQGGRDRVARVMAEKCWSLAEDCREMPIRHFIEHLVCTGDFRGTWSRSVFVRARPRIPDGVRIAADGCRVLLGQAFHRAHGVLDSREQVPGRRSGFAGRSGGAGRVAAWAGGLRLGLGFRFLGC